MKFIRLILVLLALVPSLVFAQRIAPLENPEPLAIPESLTTAEAKEVITDALFNRGWTIAEDSGDTMVADLQVRDHWLQVDISIADNQIALSYRDSDNLNYGTRRGTEVIHRSYGRWTDTLLSDIRSNMARLEHRRSQ
ncbi:hypothetical protein [Marinimicrobium sp. ABcell2]|uniref:hypothetical protein n=1 Tax=Marinimicrobium sp. ABcell2 TaxID=3069751 RepID=UPI0027AE476E|nr:hypothetical protein [Marinimicrobium sp. ABcell2]MDQ2076642.1 hypothetical protein [Marinimicrobium sp. ABcell2]